MIRPFSRPWVPPSLDRRPFPHVLEAVHGADADLAHVGALEDFQRDLDPWGAGGPDALVEVVELLDPLAGERQDDVAGGDPGLVRGAVAAHADHLEAPVLLDRAQAEPWPN